MTDDLTDIQTINTNKFSM